MKRFYYAECDGLGVYVSGPTRDLVIKEFNMVVVDFFFFYKSLGPDDVVGSACEYREKFSKYFRLVEDV